MNLILTPIDDECPECGDPMYQLPLVHPDPSVIRSALCFRCVILWNHDGNRQPIPDRPIVLGGDLDQQASCAREEQGAKEKAARQDALRAAFEDLADTRTMSCQGL